jgi:WD40 repeat protein
MSLERRKQSLGTLSGHTHWVISACFSPPNEYSPFDITSASHDGTVRLWTHLYTRHTLQLPDGANQATYSPDGKRIAVACLDGSAYIWDAETQSSLLELKGHTKRVNSANYNSFGDRIITASNDNTAIIWNALTGEREIELRGHQKGSIGGGRGSKGSPSTFSYTGIDNAVFSPDGCQVVTASYDGTARIWDVNTGSQLKVLYGHMDWVMSADYSNDGKKIVTCGWDNTARLWDVETGNELIRLIGHGSWIRRAHFSPDDRTIVTAGNDLTIRLW